MKSDNFVCLIYSSIEDDYKPDTRTIKHWLKAKYGDEILISWDSGRDLNICFKGLSYQVISKKMFTSNTRMSVRKDQRIEEQ